MNRDDFYALVYDIVRRVPRGRVVTYGQVSSTIGYPRHARMVGRALRALPERSDVPWQRVVNASGAISRRSAGDSHELQRLLLEAEGIPFDRDGTVRIEDVRWEPPESAIASRLQRKQ